MLSSNYLLAAELMDNLCVCARLIPNYYFFWGVVSNNEIQSALSAFIRSPA